MKQLRRCEMCRFVFCGTALRCRQCTKWFGRTSWRAATLGPRLIRPELGYAWQCFACNLRSTSLAAIIDHMNAVDHFTHQHPQEATPRMRHERECEYDIAQSVAARREDAT